MSSSTHQYNTRFSSRGQAPEAGPDRRGQAPEADLDRKEKKIETDNRSSQRVTAPLGSLSERARNANGDSARVNRPPENQRTIGIE